MGKGRSPSRGDNGLLAAIMAVAETIFAPADASTGESWGEGPHLIAPRHFQSKRIWKTKAWQGGLNRFRHGRNRLVKLLNPFPRHWPQGIQKTHGLTLPDSA